MNGLIVWFQRPIPLGGGLTGLFNNANYTGSWLILIWPFCLAILLQSGLNIYKRSVAISIAIGVFPFKVSAPTLIIAPWGFVFI